MALFGVTAFLVTNKHGCFAADGPKTTYDSLVVTYGTVAVEFNKIIADQLQVLQRIGPLGVARYLYPLPAIEVGIDMGLCGFKFFLQLIEGGRHVDLGLFLNLFHLFDLRLQVGKGLLKIESDLHTLCYGLQI